MRPDSLIELKLIHKHHLSQRLKRKIKYKNTRAGTKDKTS